MRTDQLVLPLEYIAIKAGLVDWMASALLGKGLKVEGKFSVAGMRQDIHSFLIELHS